jgi:hypothetical protein
LRLGVKIRYVKPCRPRLAWSAMGFPAEGRLAGASSTCSRTTTGHLTVGCQAWAQVVARKLEMGLRIDPCVLLG